MSRIRLILVPVVLAVTVACFAEGCKKDDEPFYPVFHITTSSRHELAVGAPCSIQLEAAFGTEPYHSWTITAGSLPGGLNLDSASGLITGAASTAGTYTFTVEVSDNADPQRTASKDFALEVSVAEWTVMMYMNADNDLEWSAIEDLDMLEAAGGSSVSVNVIAQLDRHPGFDSTNGDWSTCKRFYVTADQAQGTIDSHELSDLGEVNMCTVATLQDFLEWGMGTFESERYALVIWDHGMTWATFSSDWTDGNDHLQIVEMDAAINTALAICSVPELDFLGFDLCLGATLEAVAQFHDSCRVLVASPEITHGAAWDYEPWLSWLRRRPDSTPQKVGARMVDAFASWNAREKWPHAALVALDLSTAPDALSHLEDAVTHLRSNMAAEGLNIGLARSHADDYSDVPIGPDTAADVGDLLYVLKHITADPVLRAYLEDSLAALDGMIIERYCSEEHRFAVGLSIFFPEEEASYQDKSALYAATSFAASYSWDEMLTDYYAFVAAHPNTFYGTNMTHNGTTVTPDTPVTFEGDIHGEGIYMVRGDILRLEGMMLVDCCWEPITRPEVLPNGRTIDSWYTDTTWHLSYTWDGYLKMLNDGTTTSPMRFDLNDTGYAVDADYSTDGGFTWFECEGHFDKAGNLLLVVDYTSAFPRGFSPVEGDLFRPVHTCMSTDGSSAWLAPGPGMDATSVRIEKMQASPGTYHMSIEAYDPFLNNVAMRLIVNVP
jgi:hypothetical protein